MNMELLGFDVRLCPEDYVAQRWNQERRDTFLISSNIKWPLSVDQNVWPSLFRFQDIFSHTEPYAWTEDALEIPADDFRQQTLDVWSNVPSMVECFLKYRHLHGKNGIPIAVELVEVAPTSSSQFWRAVLEPALTERIPEDWILIGYDVADERRYSGLSGCAYSSNEKVTLQDTWANRLNEYGLLRTLDDALSFKNITDNRVREHAPFYIYKLYRGEDILKAKGTCGGTDSTSSKL